MSTTTAKRIDANSLNLKEQVVSINRVTKVVKGGKNLSFSALVVVGDPGAKIVGFGTGKGQGSACGDQEGHRGGQEEFAQDPCAGDDDSASGAGAVWQRACAVKACTCWNRCDRGRTGARGDSGRGHSDVLTKTIGSRNPHNVVKATINALEGLRDKAR
jgi:small subunit ribosomal protein S5